MATATDALIPELEGYRQQFLSAKEEYKKLVEGLTDEQFNWRPGEDQWSMAECIDHLIMIGDFMNRSINTGIDRANERNWKSDGPFKYGAVGNWFVRSVSGTDAARKRKFKAPTTYTPTSNHSLSRIDSAFITLQDEFVDRLERANGLDIAKVKLPSPVTRLIRLSLGQWFALLAGHQERHFAQAREVREHLPK